MRAGKSAAEPILATKHDAKRRLAQYGLGTSSNFGNRLSMAVASLFLPFLPMHPAQILLNNLLYDLAQISIPSDNVDAEHLKHPHRWNFMLIRHFMIFIGPVRSRYNFLTFFVLLRVFHTSEVQFRTGELSIRALVHTGQPASVEPCCYRAEQKPAERAIAVLVHGRRGVHVFAQVAGGPTKDLACRSFDRRTMPV